MSTTSTGKAFAIQAEARPPSEVTMTFIDVYQGEYGLQPICAALPIAPPRTTRTARAGPIRYRARRAPRVATGHDM